MEMLIAMGGCTGEHVTFFEVKLNGRLQRVPKSGPWWQIAAFRESESLVSAIEYGMLILIQMRFVLTLVGAQKQ